VHHCQCLDDEWKAGDALNPGHKKEGLTLIAGYFPVALDVRFNFLLDAALFCTDGLQQGKVSKH